MKQSRIVTRCDVKNAAELREIDNVYIEIMEMCQPFYVLPKASQASKMIQLTPRLEDSLFLQQKNILENPQDPMCSSSFQRDCCCPRQRQRQQGENSHES